LYHSALGLSVIKKKRKVRLEGSPPALRLKREWVLKSIASQEALQAIQKKSRTVELPHGGLRGFRPPLQSAGYVTTIDAHKSLKLIARMQVDF